MQSLGIGDLRDLDLLGRYIELWSRAWFHYGAQTPLAHVGVYVDSDHDGCSLTRWPSRGWALTCDDELDFAEHGITLKRRVRILRLGARGVDRTRVLPAPLAGWH